MVLHLQKLTPGAVKYCQVLLKLVPETDFKLHKATVHDVTIGARYSQGSKTAYIPGIWNGGILLPLHA